MSKMYESGTAAQSYNASRSLPEHALSIVRNLLTETLPIADISSVLDLGGGTGRFSSLLQTVCTCPVYTTDPSIEMLRQGVSREVANIHWIGSKAEALPFSENSIDFIFMAQVYHHLENRRQAFTEIARVLKPSGYLIIRNGIQEDVIVHQQFFPETITADAERIPLGKDLIDAVSANGFSFIRQQTDFQMFASSRREYYEKVRQRGLSALLLISDEAFNQGVERMREWVVDGAQTDTPVYESITHFIFTNKP